MARRRPDPAARLVVLGVAAGRIAIGLGVTLATGPALRLLGFPPTDSSGRALARLAGGRDVALGALAFGARGDRAALRTVGLAGTAVDAGDAVSLGLAALRGEPIHRAGALGALSGTAAAAAGAWATGRLR